MIKTMKTAKQFYDFYKAIPENKWTRGRYKEGNTFCALGHLGFRGISNIFNNKNAVNLACVLGKPVGYIADVNDGSRCKNLGKTPRQRILAVLKTKLKKV